MAIESSIINATDKLQVNINIETSDLSWMIGLVIATITLGGIVWSGILTRRSNKLSELEIKARLQPALIFQNWNGKVIEQNNKIECSLWNQGTIPAKNIRYYIFFKSTKIGLNEIIMQEKSVKNSQEYRIEGVMPIKTGETIQHDLPDDLKGHDELWLAFWFVYDFLDIINNEEIIIIHHRKNNRMKFLDFDHEHIQQSRKHG